MNPLQWSNGDRRWYFGVQCLKCQLPILFAIDHSKGAIDAPRSAAARLVLTCTRRECGHRADYTSAAVLSLQKSQSENEGGHDRERVEGGKRRRA